MGLLHSFQREVPQGFLLKGDARVFSRRPQGAAAQSPADKEGSVQGAAPTTRGYRSSHGVQGAQRVLMEFPSPASSALAGEHFWGCSGENPHRSRPSGLPDLRAAIFWSFPCPLTARRWKKTAVNQQDKTLRQGGRGGAATRGYRDSKGNPARDPRAPPGPPLTPRPGPHSPSGGPAPPPPRRQPMAAPAASARASPPPGSQWARSSRRPRRAAGADPGAGRSGGDTRGPRPLSRPGPSRPGPAPAPPGGPWGAPPPPLRRWCPALGVSLCPCIDLPGAELRPGGVTGPQTG